MSNNLNLTPEMLEKAKSASSATALLTLAQENGTTLTAEQAVTYYAQFHPEIGAISDEELDNVSGGGLCDSNPPPPQPEKCKHCECTEFTYIKPGAALRDCWICNNCNMQSS